MLSTMLRVLFCGGGSVGHLAPSLAVWQALSEKHKDAKALFTCSFSERDRSFLHAQGLQYAPMPAPRLKNPLFILLFPLACLEALIILLWFRPHVIFAKGGYVSVPLSLMGWILRLPIVLHESDSVLGRANRMLLRFSRHLCTGAPQKELAGDTAVIKRGIPVTATGNPIRKHILTGSVDGGRRVTGFSGKRPVLLVMGGSQGAEVLNNALHAILHELLIECDVIHLTGRGKMKLEMVHARYLQREFADEDLPHYYALSDIVVSRAGAGSLAELAALSKAVILVPLPDLAHKHQEENARFLHIAEAVIVLQQETLRKTLLLTIQGLLADSKKREILGKRLHAFSVPDAAERITNILLEEANL